jgi:sec-independent protein translocase protein TatC
MAIKGLFKFREDPETDSTKPFLDHLEDLRWTLFKMGTTLIATMMCCFAFRSPLIRFVQAPLYAVDPRAVSALRTLAVTDSIMISFQLAFYAGLVLSFPLLLYFLAQFVLPALTPKERRYVAPAILVGFGLFLTGVSFCYKIILPKTLAFFFEDTLKQGWMPSWTVRDYFSFVTQITVTFGLAFELPVAVLVLVYLGVVNVAFLRRTRAYAIVLIMVFAAVIAPTPDPITFLSLALPMCMLYEVCIWLSLLVERRKVARQIP